MHEVAMKPMVYAVPSRGWRGFIDCIHTWFQTASTEYSMMLCMGQDVVPAMQCCYEETKSPVLGYIHDDVNIFEKGWDRRVLSQFDDPRVGLVGFGGAIGHGRPELYSVPYHLPNLARQDFLSNMSHAELHGKRFTGERDVAVLDGFALFVRRSILDMAGGWPVKEPYGYFMYSEWLCCETRRQEFRIRLVGVNCDHLGGRSSGSISPNENYELAHEYFYEHNRDVMPYRVRE